MRLAIHDYSQEVAVAMTDTVTEKGKEKRIAIDATDLLILDWFTKFYPSMAKTVIDGKEYGWIKRSKVIEDLPILRISEESVSGRLKKMVHFKLLDYKLVKNSEVGTRCYYTHGESYPQLVYDFSTVSDGGYRVKPTRGSGSNPHRVSGQPDNKDSYLDSNHKISKGYSRNSYEPPEPTRCPDCKASMSYMHQLGCYQCLSCYSKYDRELNRL